MKETDLLVMERADTKEIIIQKKVEGLQGLPFVLIALDYLNQHNLEVQVEVNGNYVDTLSKLECLTLDAILAMLQSGAKVYSAKLNDDLTLTFNEESPAKLTEEVKESISQEEAEVGASRVKDLLAKYDKLTPAQQNRVLLRLLRSPD